MILQNLVIELSAESAVAESIEIGDANGNAVEVGAGEKMGYSGRLKSGAQTTKLRELVEQGAGFCR